ncbi:cation channel sperm-associated auxiliary subunit delta isoform X2 [Erinaceus europaeus]|uniref:Cation channel sperm-associated auxiliary subunit delta n=1 Tax=Erinaceus europaeus TaxID=9365 RepID=A0ABM3WMZ1_ERIEU|nr:cation channel sperm-associated auxiliary subunit delta isoform X2 [Erinaceus europaeus]
MQALGMPRAVLMLSALMVLPAARAQPLCKPHKIRTEKVFPTTHRVPGEKLYYIDTPHIVPHPCRKKIAVYLGSQVLLTMDNFESSLTPLSIPAYFSVLTPEVTSVHFTEHTIIFVINEAIYVLNLDEDSWDLSNGVIEQVSHVTGDNCCYSPQYHCSIINTMALTYMQGGNIKQTPIYRSDSEGFYFDEFTPQQISRLDGTLGGIFHFHSLSEIGIMVIKNNKAMFSYSDHPLNRSFGLAFDYNETLKVLITPGQKGIIIFWGKRSLQISRNTGQLVDPIRLQDGQTVYYSLYETNLEIHSIAANENEVAFLTTSNSLYYGSLGILSGPMIKLGDQNLWTKDTAIKFTEVGLLDVLTPHYDQKLRSYDFVKCSVNIQAKLTEMMVDVCKVELLYGDFENQMYTIDMNSELQLHAFMIPRLGKSPVPVAMVSNPHSLGLEAILSEAGYTYDGNTKYRLDITLKQQHHWGRADPNFTSNIEKPTLSTLTVDIANKEISCVDLKPLSALISLGCDVNKKIIIQKEVTACDEQILDAEELQQNYSYILEKEAHDPRFLGKPTDADREILYNYQQYGCPILIYYDHPWRPVVELWENNKFVEEVDAEFVLLEMNGLFTYSYLLTAKTAHCITQPQNWTSNIKDSGPYSWSRENYISCYDPENDAPLLWPDVEYQVLGGPTENKMVFNKRNGIYVFFATIVDPYYSYCRLSVSFSVYVYGALPERMFVEAPCILLLEFIAVMTIFLAYIIPKILHPERGAETRRFWVAFWYRCRARLQACMRS